MALEQAAGQGQAVQTGSGLIGAAGAGPCCFVLVLGDSAKDLNGSSGPKTQFADTYALLWLKGSSGLKVSLPCRVRRRRLHGSTVHPSLISVGRVSGHTGFFDQHHAVVYLQGGTVSDSGHCDSTYPYTKGCGVYGYSKKLHKSTKAAFRQLAGLSGSSVLD